MSSPTRARPNTPSPRRSASGTFFAAVLLACASWLGLFFLIRNVLPYAGARWFFFVLLYIAIASSAIPLAQFLNRRWNRREPSDWVSVRQGLWMGLYITTCAWLQIPRVLTPVIAVLLGLALLILEVFLRLRELSRDAH